MPTKVTFRSFWTSAEECSLMKMKVNGLPVKVIGYLLGRSDSSVRGKWLRMNPRTLSGKWSFSFDLLLVLKIACFAVLAIGFLFLAATTPVGK